MSKKKRVKKFKEAKTTKETAPVKNVKETKEEEVTPINENEVTEENFEFKSECIEGIIQKMTDLGDDLRKSLKVNAAAKRARKTTSELDKIFKAYRKASVEHYKK